MEGRVLVVDDTEAKRYFIVKTLGLAGMEVMEAGGGQEALEAAALLPDVVVLDVRLPDMSGFEVCRRLKADPLTAAIPVLYISSMMRDEELEARLFDDGADGYIPQPIEPKHLVAQTWALVRMRRAQLQRQRERDEARSEQQRLERELERSQARARRLTESGMVGVFYWDVDGSVLEANDTFLAMVGYAREDLAAGRLDWRALSPSWGEPEQEELRAVLERGVGSLKEGQYLRRDGSRVDVLLGSATFESEAHRGVTMVVDISARRDAERRLTQAMQELDAKQRLLDAVLRQMPMGIRIAEAPSGHSLLTNERFTALLGSPALPGMEAALDRGEEVEEELVQRHVDGSLRRVHAHAVPVRGARGELIAGVLTLEDITERTAVQESLRLGEERLRLTLESAALGVWSFDPATRGLTWDARTRELFALPSDVTVSLDVWLERIHPEDRERVASLTLAAAAQERGGLVEVEYRAIGLQDGGVLRWLSSRGRVQRQEGGGWRLMGTVLDITPRKLAERYADALQATTATFAHALTSRQVADALVRHGLETMNASAGAVFSVATGGQLELLHTLGYPEATARAYRDVALSRLRPLLEAIRTGQPVWAESLAEALQRGEPEVRAETLGTAHRAWLCMPLKGEERVEWVLGLSFTTPRRFSPQEQTHLESLCALGAQALARARLFEDTQHRAEREQQFLGMVSHDLRNPLQAISLGARTLQRLERPSPEALLRMTGRIATSADTMGRMVSDLLDFTRGRLGGGIPLERTAGDLMRVVHEVLDEFSLTHPEGTVVLEGETACEGVWDAPRMRQVLSNLLSNALRHARAGTVVQVRVRCTEQEVVLSVENEGEPIPGELLPVLFEPFRRGSTTFRPAGSLGLGLYIVHQVVLGHGGQVGVESGPAGTRFTVRLPRQGKASREPGHRAMVT